MLLYIGTVILKIPEGKFWRTTLRKFKALLSVHEEMNATSNQNSNSSVRATVKQGYIDQIF
jgi:hypothetical protein